MNIYLEAPNELEYYSVVDRNRSVFLAGSITGAWDWQKDAARILCPHFSVFNPRRQNFDATNKSVEKEQIAWEFKHLDIAGITLFYFSHETLAPITLLEYGKQLVKCQYAPWRRTYVCIHPSYARKNDVLIQTELQNPEMLANIFNQPEDMYAAIIAQNS
jgi:hypothetical protein